MNNISWAGSGLCIVIITSILKAFGIEADSGTVEGVVNSAVIVIGWILLIVGQLRRRDLRYGLVRK